MGNWGHCIHCKYFGQEGASDRTANQAERHCSQPELEHFELVVTGSSGCNHFSAAAGLSPDVEEPAAAPGLPRTEDMPSSTIH